jgi:hypothetical protein
MAADDDSHRALHVLGDGTHGIALTIAREILTSDGIGPFVHRSCAASS